MRRMATNTLMAAMLAIAVAGCASVAEGHDPVVVNAERGVEVTEATLTAFVTWAHLHEATLGDGARSAANAIRAKAPGVIDSVRRTTKVYKNSRTAENKANLVTWLSVLSQLEQEALQWYNP